MRERQGEPERSGQHKNADRRVGPDPRIQFLATRRHADRSYPFIVPLNGSEKEQLARFKMWGSTADGLWAALQNP